VLLTTAAMICFAGNSLLCRLALRTGAIDAVSFTAVRLVSAAAVMGFLVRVSGQVRAHAGSWSSALALFGYAIGFSIAYLQIGAGIGALLLFGAVQITMIGWALLRGERPGAVQWIGIALAVGGLVLLTRPGTSGSPLLGMALMLAAGVGWGTYSLRGRGSSNPLQTTAANFLRTLPLVALMVPIGLAIAPAHLTARGVALGIASGGVTSGIGYAIWYRALAKLTAVQAASVQLTVPVLAAAGGVALLGEQITLRLLAAAVLTLGGIGLTIVRRTPATR
jgi:drug/metabolite transporter (DMT)-like permease